MRSGRSSFSILFPVACAAVASIGALSCSADTADPAPPDLVPIGPAPTSARDAAVTPLVDASGSVVFGKLEAGANTIGISPTTAALVVDPSGAKGQVRFQLTGNVDGTPVWAVTNPMLGSVDQSG